MFVATLLLLPIICLTSFLGYKTKIRINTSLFSNTAVATKCFLYNNAEKLPTSLILCFLILSRLPVSTSCSESSSNVLCLTASFCTVGSVFGVLLDDALFIQAFNNYSLFVHNRACGISMDFRYPPLMS